MQCPSCGWKAMQRARRDLRFVYKSRQLIVKRVTGDFCPKCDEAVLADAESERYALALREHVRAVNRESVPDLRGIRKRLGLSQRRAAEIFGGGINAFSRYERGEVEPPRSLVKLLQLLGDHPELLGEIQTPPRPAKIAPRGSTPLRRISTGRSSAA